MVLLLQGSQALKEKTPQPLEGLVKAGLRQSSLPPARCPWHQGIAVLSSGCKASTLASVPREVASPHTGRDHQLHFPVKLREPREEQAPPGKAAFCSIPGMGGTWDIRLENKP